jgi:hypothetical protein
MPVIYLTHPIHGAKMATMEEEAVYDEQHGWNRYNPDTPSVQVEEAAPVNALEVRRRGRRAAAPVEEATTE